MRFAVYCPCKVRELGVEVIMARQFRTRTFNYILYLDIKSKGSAFGVYDTRCGFCGEFLLLVGNDVAVDAAAGVTPTMIQRDIAEAEQWHRQHAEHAALSGRCRFA